MGQRLFQILQDFFGKTLGHCAPIHLSKQNLDTAVPQHLSLHYPIVWPGLVREKAHTQMSSHVFLTQPEAR